MNSALTLLHMIVTCLIWVCVVVAALKIVWNLCVPYALIRRGPDKGGVSVFPLIELLPLLVAAVLSWISSQQGILAPKQLLALGGILVMSSYLHLFAVLFIAGFVRRFFTNDEPK